MADNKEPTTSAASVIEAALKSGPAPKKDEPPKILPNLDVPDGATVVNEKVTVEPKEPTNIPDILEEVSHATTLAVDEAIAEALTKINPEMVCRLVSYLLTQRGPQNAPPRKDFSTGYTQSVKSFIAKGAQSSLNETLSKVTDVVFLQRLLDDILDVLETKGADIPPQLNSPSSSGDPILRCLAAAPPCHGRANAEMLAPHLEFW